MAGDLLRRLRSDGARLAAAFGLSYRAILAERASARSHYGICTADGVIKIRLLHTVRRTPLRYSSLVNTLCHELAHLRHFHHGPAFRALYERILRHARREGIYRPGGGGLRAAPPTCGVTPEERRRFLEQMRRAAARAAASPMQGDPPQGDGGRRGR